MGPAVLTLLAALSVGQLAHSTLGGSFSFPGAPPAQASSVTDWSKSGALPGYWGPGIPAPSISCVANASNGMDCTGATPTPQGSPVSVGSPFHPDGLWTSETDVPALSLNGSTDYVDLGNTGGATTGLAICGWLNPNTAIGWSYPISKDDENISRSYALLACGGSACFYIFKSNSLYTDLTIGSLPAGQWSFVCASYDGSGGDGDAILRGNINGSVPTEITTGHAPIQTVTAGLRFGASSFPSYWAGVQGSWAIWTQSLSAAQLVTISVTQRSLLAARPAGAAVTWAHNETAPVFPVSDSVGYWMAPNTALVESAGAFIGGASSNLFTYSTITDAHATKDGATTIADASASCPLGPFGARMALVTPDANAHGVRMDAATGTGRGLWLALATGDSACAVTLADYADAHGAAKTLAALPHWYAGATAGDHGIAVTQPAGGCVRFCADNALAMAQTWAPVPEQFRVTNGAPFSGPASVVSAANTLTNPARWARSVTVAPAAGWTDAGVHTLWSHGTTADANRMRAYQTGIDIELLVYNSGSYKYWLCPHGLTGTGSATVNVSMNAGAPTITAAGLLLTCTPAGPGTGIQDALPALTWRGTDDLSTYPLNGAVKCYREGPSLSASVRCP